MMENDTKWRPQIQKQVDSLTSEIRFNRSVLIGRGNPTDIIKRMMEFFSRIDETRKVYLELDRNKTNGQIADCVIYLILIGKS